MSTVGNPQHSVDFLAFIVATTLLFVGGPVAADQSLFSAVTGYMAVRQALPFSIYDDSTPENDFLGSLWQAVGDHKTNHWPYLSTVYKPWQDDAIQQQLIKNDDQRHDDTLAWFAPFCDESQQLVELLLGRIAVSSQSGDDVDAISGLRKESELVERQFVSGGKVASLISPRSSVRLLKTISDHSISAAERWAFEDYACDTLHFFQMNSDEATKQLLNLPYFPAVSAKTPAAFEDLLAESLFGELLRMPDSPHNFLLYSVVLCKVCRTYSDFPPALADLANALFASCPRLSVGSFTKFVDWFAYHLSNFDFAWDWPQWVADGGLTLPDGSISASLNRKTHFIKEVLQRCVRLSFYERVERSVPQSFVTSGLLPPKPAHNNPFGKNDDQALDPRVAETAAIESVPVSQRPQLVRPAEASFYSLPITKDLVDAIVNKIPEEQMAQLLDKAQSELRPEEIIETVVRSVIIGGSKTPAHLQRDLDRMLPVLFGFTYGGDDASARHAKASKAEGEIIVGAVWKHLYNSPHHLLICLLKMLHAELISPKNVIDFLLRVSTLAEFGHCLFLWELVDQTIRMTLEKAKLIALQLLHSQVADSNRALLENQLSRYHKKLRAALVHFFSRASVAATSKTDATSYQFEFFHSATYAVARKYYRYIKENIDVLSHTLEAVPAMDQLDRELRFLAANY